jgi:parvulin-like peptidyl-prolyl isomerase
MNALMMAVLLMEPFTVEKVVAIVGDEPILHSEVETLLTETGLPLTGDFTVDSRNPGYSTALEQLIEEQLVVQAATEAGYYPESDVLDGLVDDEIARLGESYATDEFYDDYVRSMGSDPATVPAAQEQSIREYLAGEQFMEELIASAGLTMVEYRAFLADFLGDRQAAQTFIGYKVQEAMASAPISPLTFLASRADLVEEVVKPRHIGWIYLPVLPSGPDLDAAVMMLEGLRQRILAGESFETLAAEFSEDGSASNGGSLGVFGPGDMVPSFELAAFALEPGEVSLPVVSPFGVHLIRMDSRNEDGTIEASHILRLVAPDAEDLDAAMARAEEIRGTILSGGMTFEEAAAEYSMDRASAVEGGDLGMIPLNLWLEPLADAAAELEPGEISDVEVLPDAGAVVLITSLGNEGELDWSTYSDEDLQGLVQQVIYEDTYDTLVDSLRNVVPVVINLQAESL